jgi:hypothetical protein
VFELRLGEHQQQRFLFVENGDFETTRVAFPAVAVGFAARVAFDVEVFAEQVHVALHGAVAEVVTRISQMVLYVFRADGADFGHSAQDFQQRHHAAHVVIAGCHDVLLK